MSLSERRREEDDVVARKERATVVCIVDCLQNSDDTTTEGWILKPDGAICSPVLKTSDGERTLRKEQSWSGGAESTSGTSTMTMRELNCSI